MKIFAQLRFAIPHRSVSHVYNISLMVSIITDKRESVLIAFKSINAQKTQDDVNLGLMLC
jgi:hypothetical protein